MITGLYNALVDRGLQDKIGILADESSSLSRATGEYADWLPEVIDMVRLLKCREAYLWMVNCSGCLSRTPHLRFPVRRELCGLRCRRRGPLSGKGDVDECACSSAYRAVTCSLKHTAGDLLLPRRGRRYRPRLVGRLRSHDRERSHVVWHGLPEYPRRWRGAL